MQQGADTFSYDPLSRLTAASVAGAASTYQYDGDGLLAIRTGSTGSTNYVWDTSTAPAPLLEAGGDRVVHGLGPLYLERADGSTIRLVRDALGSVRAEVDDLGLVTKSFRYAAYGAISDRFPSSATPTLLGFTGEIADPSGLTYLRARWYEPSHGRFVSRDPYAGTLTGPVSLNAYIYAAGRPNLLTDPLGLDPGEPDRDPGLGCQKFVLCHVIPVLSAEAAAVAGRDGRRVPTRPGTLWPTDHPVRQGQSPHGVRKRGFPEGPSGGSGQRRVQKDQRQTHSAWLRPANLGLRRGKSKLGAKVVLGLGGRRVALARQRPSSREPALGLQPVGCLEQPLGAPMMADRTSESAVVWQLHRERSGDVIRVVLPDRASALLLRNLLQRVADLGQPVSVGLERRMKLSGIIRVILRRAEQPSRKALSGQDGSFEWTCTREQWLVNAGLLEPFRLGRAGHQYLTDEGIDDALVEVSFGED
ncbi:MAG: RHS repeat domain-containing protein [Candidatus Limnocylindria bacterium]